MPTHRILRATLHEDLLDIERKQGEKVLSIVVDPDDSQRYIVETEKRSTLETRGSVVHGYGATHLSEVQ